MMVRMLVPAAISVDTPAKARKEGSERVKLKPLLTYDLQNLLFLLLCLPSLCPPAELLNSEALHGFAA